MTDTTTNGDLAAALRTAREHAGLSREKVAGKLDPPVSSKTIERWETPGVTFARIDRRRFYLAQFAALYGTEIEAERAR